MRTKRKAIAKSNATGWHLLSARELHTGIFQFNDWGLHDVRATCRFKAFVHLTRRHAHASTGQLLHSLDAS